MSFQINEEIESFCSKCSDLVLHIITALKNESTIKKVTCKTCKASHAYKATAPSAKSLEKKRKSSGRGSEGGRGPGSANNEEIWKKMMSGAGQANKAKNYSLDTNFKKGDIVKHPEFGDGLVERLIDRNKIQVVFKDQARLLMHNIQN